MKHLSIDVEHIVALTSVRQVLTSMQRVKTSRSSSCYKEGCTATKVIDPASGRYHLI